MIHTLYIHVHWSAHVQGSGTAAVLMEDIRQEFATLPQCSKEIHGLNSFGCSAKDEEDKRTPLGPSHRIVTSHRRERAIRAICAGIHRLDAIEAQHKGALYDATCYHYSFVITAVARTPL